MTVGGLGSRLAHVHQDVSLDGRGAHAEVNGLSFATGKQRLSYYTQQSHRAPDTHSDLLYRNVLRDQARVIWRGMIQVDKVAQKTDGYQISQSLLLDDDSQFLAKPELEIYADDVACSHGSTSGAIDEDGLFYLRARGLPRGIAEDLLTIAFIAEAVQEVEDESLQEEIVERVEAWLFRRRD